MQAAHSQGFPEATETKQRKRQRKRPRNMNSTVNRNIQNIQAGEYKLKQSKQHQNSTVVLYIEIQTALHQSLLCETLKCVTEPN